MFHLLSVKFKIPWQIHNKTVYILLPNVNLVSLNLNSTDSEQLSQLRVSKKTLQGGDGLEKPL